MFNGLASLAARGSTLNRGGISSFFDLAVTTVEVKAGMVGIDALPHVWFAQ